GYTSSIYAHSFEDGTTTAPWPVENYQFDLAIIKLSKPINFSDASRQLAPACLSTDAGPFHNQPLQAFGFGKIYSVRLLDLVLQATETQQEQIHERKKAFGNRLKVVYISISIFLFIFKGS